MKKILLSIALLTTGICMGSDWRNMSDEEYNAILTRHKWGDHGGDTCDIVHELMRTHGMVSKETASIGLDGVKLDEKVATAPTSSTKIGGPFPTMKKAEVLKVLASPSTSYPVDKVKGIVHLIGHDEPEIIVTSSYNRLSINPTTHAQYSDTDRHKYIPLDKAKKSEKCTEKNIVIELPGVSDPKQVQHIVSDSVGALTKVRGKWIDQSQRHIFLESKKNIVVVKLPTSRDPHQAKAQDKHQGVDLPTKYMTDKEMVKYAPSLAEEHVFETTKTWRRS